MRFMWRWVWEYGCLFLCSWLCGCSFYWGVSGLFRNCIFMLGLGYGWSIILSVFCFLWVVVFVSICGLIWVWGLSLGCLKFW